MIISDGSYLIPMNDKKINKVVILAGGYGTRISEETDLRPKPMIEIGEKPLLWHIMKIYSYYGFNDFYILLGYKGYYIKEYFNNFFLHQSDVTIDLSLNTIKVHNSKSEPWKVTLLDTGMDTMTGGRIKRAQHYLKDEAFMLTYGDGLADINLDSLIKFHRSNGKIATITSVQPEGRFGAIEIDDNHQVKKFVEKPAGDNFWINGGFFVCEPEIFNYIGGDNSIFEQESLNKLVDINEICTYKHYGFWKCLDTLRDKNQLSKMWDEKAAKWKIWRD